MTNTLADLLERAVSTYGDQIAFRLEGPAPEAWSFARLGRAVQSIAVFLRRDLEIERGQRVLVWGSASSPHLTATYLGCIRAGIILVPIDPRSSEEFVRRIAGLTEARVLIVDGSHGSEVPARRVALADLPDGTGPLATQLDDRPAPEDIAEIVFTSGTTGDPKGVILTHRNIMANLDSICDIVPRRPYRLISLLPVSHMLEQTPAIFMALEYGAEVVYVPSRQPASILLAMQRRRPNMMVVVPLVLEMLMRGIEREVRAQGKWRLWQLLNAVATRLPMQLRRVLFKTVHAQLGGALEMVFCGGARLDPSLAGSWERLGVKVVEGYGATECAPVITGNRIDRRIIGSVGRAVKGVEIRVSDEDELQARGENVMQGYWRNEAATGAVFTPDGWYKTGDLAEIDSQGDVRLHGRLRDLIVLPSGMNVYPEDVEAAMREQPEIADCVALMLADHQERERIHAILVPADDSITDEQLSIAVQRANRGLAPHQRAAVHSRWPEEDFPRTTSMKVRRNVVRERMEAADTENVGRPRI